MFFFPANSPFCKGIIAKNFILLELPSAPLHWTNTTSQFCVCNAHST